MIVGTDQDIVRKVPKDLTLVMQEKTTTQITSTTLGRQQVLRLPHDRCSPKVFSIKPGWVTWPMWEKVAEMYIESNESLVGVDFGPGGVMRSFRSKT